MDKEKNEEKFVIEGNPGTGNTFVKIGHVDHYNPSATSATTNITNNYYYGKGEDEAGENSVSSKPGDKKLGNMTFREMLKAGYVDTGNIQLLIMNYVSCIRPYVKDEKDKLFMHLWAVIMDHEAFKIELYDTDAERRIQTTELLHGFL